MKFCIRKVLGICDGCNGKMIDVIVGYARFKKPKCMHEEFIEVGQ